MRLRSTAFSVSLTLALAACVGDDSIAPMDGGPDTSTNDATTGDAANDAAGDAAPPNDAGADAPVEAGGPKRIFATGATKNGALGGIAGADGMCSAAASAAGLGGTFLAWIALADGGASPAARFTHSTSAYKRVDGVIVANNWTELASGALQNKVNVTEDGGTAYDLAWTDTAANGTTRVSGYDCAGWTIGDNSQNGCMTNVTSSTSLDAPQCSPCYNVNTIICVEQ